MYPPTNPAINAPKNPELTSVTVLSVNEANVVPCTASIPPTNPTPYPAKVFQNALNLQPENVRGTEYETFLHLLSHSFLMSQILFQFLIKIFTNLL